MKVTIERGALVKALSHIGGVVERRNTIPILGNVLLRADNGSLSFTATDMDIEVNETVPATIGKAGGTTVPAHTLYDIARKLPEGAEVVMEADSRQMTIRAGRSNFKLGCLPVADFPQITGDRLPKRFDLAPAELAALIDRARFAMSTEETRYYLNGIYLHAAKAGNVPVLRAVATDGHRLARAEMPLPDGAAEMPGIIIPRKTVLELRKLLDEASGPVTIELSEAKVRFTLGHVVVTSKLIDGTYPDYERVIPSANDNILEVNARSFLAAVDRVSTVTANEKLRGIKIALNGNAMTLTAGSNDSGGVEELETHYDGPQLEMGFNSRYLQDIAQQIEGDACRIRFSDPSQPAILEDATDASALYVLMPMRV